MPLPEDPLLTTSCISAGLVIITRIVRPASMTITVHYMFPFLLQKWEKDKWTRSITAFPSVRILSDSKMSCLVTFKTIMARIYVLITLGREML